MNEDVPKAGKEVQDLLLKIGVPTNLIGFIYLESAEELILKDPTELYKITGLYADIARKHHTSISKVERGIRHAIHTTWMRGNAALMDELFLHNNSRKVPSNSEFISRLYFYLK